MANPPRKSSVEPLEPRESSRSLRLTSLERYHLADDRPDFPNVIACDLRVRGSVDRATAESALDLAVRRHRLAGSRLVTPRFRGPAWDLGTPSLEPPRIRAIPAADAPGDPVDAVDLSVQPSGELVIRDEGESTRLSFRIHHAAVDGGGGLQVVADWLLLYDQLSAGATPKLRDLAPDRLPGRNRLGFLTRRAITRIWIQPIAFFGAFKFLFRRVTPIAPTSHATSKEMRPAKGLLSADIPSHNLELLRNRISDGRASINDLLMQAVFRAVHEVRKQRGWHVPHEWLRLVIPMSIRDWTDRRLPAANRATIVQLDRTDRDFESADSLVQGINHELTNIRNWNLEKTFLLVLRMVSLVPGWVKRMAANPVCRATTVLTNLGAPFERLKLTRTKDGQLQAGGLVVEDVDLVVPLRPTTPLGFATLRYGNRQRLSLHYDRRLIGDALAQELLDHVVRFLQLNEQ